MSKASDEKQVRDFLSYMANPIRHVESNLKDGERINGHYMARVAEALAPWSDQAKAALGAFDRLHSLQAKGSEAHSTKGAPGSDDVQG